MEPKGYTHTGGERIGQQKRGRPRKLTYDMQQQEQGMQRLTSIIDQHPLARSIDNPFTFTDMSKLYGEKFIFSFFLKLKELYKAKDAQQCAALSIPSILVMLNRLLSERVRRMNQRYAKENAKNVDGSPRRVSGQSLLLCHVYLMLAYLYRHDNQLLNITKRSFYSHTELEPEEVHYVAQLWSRGFGHQFISAQCGIEMRRVRPLYRSLEEAHKTKASPPVGKESSRTGQIDNQKITLELYHWIRKNAQEFTLGEHTLYAIKKQELEKYVMSLENKPTEINTEEQNDIQDTANQALDDLDDDFNMNDMGDAGMGILPEAAKVPDIIDPLAEESYAVTPSSSSMLGNMVDTRRDIPVVIPENNAETVGVTVETTANPTFPPADVLDSMPDSIPDEIKPEQIDSRIDTKPYIPTTQKGKELSDLFKNG